MVATHQAVPEGYALSETGAFAQYLKPIEKSLNDDRLYRSIRLQNGLEVLLIQDPNVDKSAAALDVHVGHLSDPVNSSALTFGLLCVLDTLVSPLSTPYLDSFFFFFFFFHDKLLNVNDVLLCWFPLDVDKLARPCTLFGASAVHGNCQVPQGK